MEKLLLAHYSNQNPETRIGFELSLCAHTKEEVDVLEQIANLLKPFGGVGFAKYVGDQAVLGITPTFGARSGAHPHEEIRALVNSFSG